MTRRGPRMNDASGHVEVTGGNEQQRKTAGQRRINLVWEGTQAIVTLSVTAATIWTAIHGIESSILNNGFLVIVATYYTRTNHTKSSGTEEHR